ncbi:MAG: hypothetical protein WAX77_06865 [Methylococcaceae bacterium]
MHAIEFETQVCNGIVQIPQQYLAWKNKTVKVILLDTEKQQSVNTNKRPIGQYLGKMKMSDDFCESLSDEFWLGETK